jgi:Uma2 family endonuclease
MVATGYKTLEQLCAEHPDKNFESNIYGVITEVVPQGGTGGKQEARFIGALWVWNERSQRGEVFSSQTNFEIMPGVHKMPDAAWVSKARWQQLTPSQQDKFVPLCPDFVVELRSPTDKLKDLRHKMLEYLAAGLRLGWLVNPADQTVEIYRSGQAVQIVTLPCVLTGEDVLPGFELRM